MRQFFGIILFSLFISSFLYAQPSLTPTLVPVIELVVEGYKHISSERILQAISIVKNKSYLVPVLKREIGLSIKNIYALGWFSNVSAVSENQFNGIKLTFKVDLSPVIESIEYTGYDYFNEADIESNTDLVEGDPLNYAYIENIKQSILSKYREEGFLFAKVIVKENYNSKNGKVKLTFVIQENEIVQVRSVRFNGNDNADADRLRSILPVKEKSWFFGVGGEFKKEKVLQSIDTLQFYYQTLGYLDAQGVDYRIFYTDDLHYVDIEIDVVEGSKYYLGQVNFIHGDILSDEQIYSRFKLNPLDVIDQSQVALSKYEIEILFRDYGYLFVRVREERVYKDSLLYLTYEIDEGNLAYVNKVHIRGNIKTRDKVIRRELRIYPSDVFSQTKIVRSQREVTQLNYFDAVLPNYEPIDNASVDIVFDVTERAKGTGTFSAGASFSQFDGIVGTLGLQMGNLFGRGQRVEVNLERGAVKQLYSFGFTEPWLFDTPTSLGGRIFWQQLENISFNQAQNFMNSFNPTGSFVQTSFGFSANIGRRLTWPDDYFTITGKYNFTSNDNGTQKDRRLLLLQSGLESSILINLIRDDKNLPVFPTKGSRYSLVYGRYGGFLGGDFDYDRFEFKIQRWISLVGSLSLSLEGEFGFIAGNNIQQFDLYRMGGVLGFQGKLRGYRDGSIGRSRIGRSFISIVTELVYPVVPNTFYLKVFFDLGDVFGEEAIFGTIDGQYSPIRSGELGSPLRDVQFSNLLADYGLGFRFWIPGLGILGFDFAWNIGTRTRLNDGLIAPKGVKVNFAIESPF